MDRTFYQNLADAGLGKRPLDAALSRRILSDSQVELLPLLNAAFEVRRKFTGNEISLHIINNAQNGFCPEDCKYCAQARTSPTGIEEYPLKSDDEILAEAEQAYARGAFRYCMVFAGRGPSQRRVEKLAQLIRTIKSRYPLEVCVSPGLLDESKARILKEAGLDRLNHNLNTSERNYPEICTTHTFQDRIRTLKAAKNADLEVCSGIIVGLGESGDEIIEMATLLRELDARSIPVNFLIDIDGTPIADTTTLTPEYCLRILCLFRFLNPDAEIRVAAGREIHFRSMQVLSLYPANSLFLQGYLNARGEGNARTLQMIQDAGFTIKSDHDLNDILATQAPDASPHAGAALKKSDELRPARK